MAINETAQKYIDQIKEKCERIKPFVVIRSLIYNHAPYLREALDSFVMQKTEFPYVAIVHDDASTDGTAEILKEYAEKYPDIILPIFEKENQWSKHDGSLGEIINTAVNISGAKYVALCEGDDYWIDTLKLQKQVDVFTKNERISLVHSNFEVVNEDGKTIEDSQCDYYKNKSKNGNLFFHIFSGNYILTCTTMVKKETFFQPFYTQSPIKQDTLVFLSAAYLGEVIYLNDKLASYRKNPQGQMLSNRENVSKNSKEIIKYTIKSYLNDDLSNLPYKTKQRLNLSLVTTFFQPERKIHLLPKNIFKLKPTLILYIPFSLLNLIKRKIKK